jgi:hypothetical protein
MPLLASAVFQGMLIGPSDNRCADMKHDEHGRRKFRRQCRRETPVRADPAGRGADDHNVTPIKLYRKHSLSPPQAVVMLDYQLFPMPARGIFKRAVLPAASC